VVVLTGVNDQTDEKYMLLLGEKLELSRQIYANTKEQSAAIESKDEVLLSELLEKREKLINRVKEIDVSIAGMNCEELSQCKAEEIIKAIKTVFSDTYKLDRENAGKAEEYQNELRKSLKHVRLGKKALSNGYLKVQPQTSGYFFDKTVGGTS